MRLEAARASEPARLLLSKTRWWSAPSPPLLLRDHPLLLALVDLLFGGPDAVGRGVLEADAELFEKGLLLGGKLASEKVLFLLREPRPELDALPAADCF
eukprot:CAMPEP_0198653778 /NCGR_PEP_ID=MMETSP1467-20131203/7280_1 /TAXON_ID=1462469 /ORGANISM="unid. sp., Strain CCMP2135" /LENGTH=98 /DNA_ID=CAMNT_0044389751 /DNA_START=268 /DNA_END=564 /DNA_ORIENTATION=+